MTPEDVALGAFLADFEGLANAADDSFIRRMKESFAWPGGDGVLKLIETLPNPSGSEGKCILVANRLLCKNRQGKSAGITRLQSPFDPAKHLPWLRRSEMADYSKAELFHPTANSQLGKDDLPDAWKGLLAAIDDLTASSGSYGIRLETWIEAFKEYALRLPGELTLFNEKPLPKTPLFLLARTRGALAHILAQSQMDESGLEELCRPGLNQPSPFSLILGDLSGLQAFLYGGATKRAVRALKGRSFYLQHIMEDMALKVREHLGLTPFAEVFCGGGRFCLIGAKGKDVSAIQGKLEKYLYEKFDGSVGLALSVTELPVHVLSGGAGGMAEVFREANQELNRSKHRKFSYLAADNHNKLFGPFWEDYECPVCGVLVGKDPGEGKGCATCESFVLMGSKLRTAKFVVETQNGSIHPLEDLNDSKLVAKSRRICCLNSFDMGTMAKAIKGLDPQPVLAARLMGVRTPVDPGKEEVTPFDQLAERSDGDKNHIAILRADVDSLGELFKQQEGLMELAAMSLALSDFFEGWITALLRRENYQDSTYLIYAGGDDLFVVGAWNSALDAARTISIEYDRFSCGKSSLSAGVEVVHKRYPLKKSAELAGEAERIAKDFRPGKNALCFLGTPLGWEEVDSVKELVKTIADAVNDEKKASRAFIRRIFEIWRAYEFGRRELEKVGGMQGADLDQAARWQRWRWMLVYGLRNDFGKLGTGIQQSFLSEKMEPYLGLTARWAQLATRRN